MSVFQFINNIRLNKLSKIIDRDNIETKFNTLAESLKYNISEISGHIKSFDDN